MNAPSSASYFIELGTAVPPVSGSTYACQEMNPRVLSERPAGLVHSGDLHFDDGGIVLRAAACQLSSTDTLGTPVAVGTAGSSYLPGIP